MKNGIILQHWNMVKYERHFPTYLPSIKTCIKRLKSLLKFIPWSRVKSWKCVGCGDCCRYTVQLSVKDWVNITRAFGYGMAIQSIGGFYLKKTVDGLCPFLLKSQRRYLCSIQYMKPIACELWPFKILIEPKYGLPTEAYFKFQSQDFYIYVNPNCRGITWGKSDDDFIQHILVEFISLRLGLQTKQYYTTSK